MADDTNPNSIADVGEKGPGFLLNHSDPAGTPRPDIWRQAVADFYQLDLDAEVLWTPIGPAPIIVDADPLHMGKGPDAGEVTDILIDPTGSSDQTIYISSDDGGIWKTADGGSTWVPLTDQMFSLSMGAVAMDPSNPKILYAGSGNLFDGGAFFTKSAGIYRSADGGLTWSIVDGGYFGTIFANVGINRIVCPAADCLLVATNQGLFRSVDGGRNFGANLPTFDDRNPVLAGRICALLLDSDTPATTVYAGVAGTGLMMSTDAGMTFGIDLFSKTGAPAAGSYNTFAIAQSAFDGATVNNNFIYASVQNTLPTNPPTQVYVGLFRSNDGGNFWVPLPNLLGVAGNNDNPLTTTGWTPQFSFRQTNYDLTLGVDPLDSHRVYAGFQQVWLSIDGGNSFQSQPVSASQVHWDNHAVVFSPSAHRGASAPTPVYTGTDGGIATSQNGGGAWNCINGNLATNLFRGIDIGKGGVDKGDGKGIPNAYTYGGCQDTGTCGHRPTDLANQWHAGINGDGWFVAVDPIDPTIVYGFDDQFFIKTTDAGAHWTSTFSSSATFGQNLTNTPPAAQRAIALEQTGLDPTVRTVYVGEGSILWKSTNSGATFVATPLAPGGFITCITTTPLAAATVWAGAFDGSVHCSLDGGTSWDVAPLITTPGGAGIAIGPVNSIAVDPIDPKRIAVVYGGVSGVHAKFKSRHVFLSLDSGAAWLDVSGTDGNGPVGNVPDLPVYSAVFDKNTSPPAILIANDAGVLRSTDATITGTSDNAIGSATWKIYGAGLPIVFCTSLAIDNSVSPPVLRVGTYGRSCFEAKRPANPGTPVFASDSNLAFGTVATGQSVTLPFYVYNCGNAPLEISAASVVGTAPFTIGATPALPVTINPAGTQAFQVTFAPTVTGDAFVLLELTTNDPTQATHTIPASGTGVNTGLVQRLATNPIATVGFGSVINVANRSIPVQLFNVGTAPLSITSITLTSGSNDFSLNPAPTFPIAIPAGGESDITIQFAPSGAGALSAEFTIASDDPRTPRKLTANGTGVLPSAAFWAQFLTLLGLGHP
jgi:photosystem II stability/assembly factor-like uncharacterized protein